MLCVCPGKDLLGQPRTGLHLDVIREPHMDNKVELAPSAASMKVLSMGTVPALAVLQGSYLRRLQQLFQVPSVSFFLGKAISPYPQHANSHSRMLSTGSTLEALCVTLTPFFVLSALATSGDVSHCHIPSSRSFPGCFPPSQTAHFGRASRVLPS